MFKRNGETDRDSGVLFFLLLSDLIAHYIAMHMQVAKCEYRALTIMFIYFAIEEAQMLTI